MNSLFTYKYYDTPEGQDIFKKVIVTSKYGVCAGLPIASFDVLLYSHPKGVFQTALRYGTYLGPLVGMATAFTLTANMACNIRGKNDELNYFMGGAAAGALFSVCRRSPILAPPAMIALGAIAVVKKLAIDYDYVFFPPVQMAAKSAQDHRNDWTLVKDIEELKTWTTGVN
ncbi:unnamed protein product [Leptidea sinapis]|uniref:NADH dehydrogenase [ubiquinone] 1 alpha subcomplex subunit 11 n=1 Tax=Leptidea sinapis TaxID=189913 RepID=A0A5E4Q859_9NEOP|nr:unnamed protein product [Leptidea sinapis]